MEALIILAGAWALIAGWLWLVVASMRRSVGKMLLALFAAPLTLLLRGMGYPLWPRLLMLAGILGIVAGGAWLQHRHPDRMHELLAGRWLDQPGTVEDLRGTIMGQPFRPTRILWRGDDLVFEEGSDGRVRRALTIRFGNARELLLQSSVDRLPSDQGLWPELVLQWHTGALSEPGLRRITDNYSLSLDFRGVEQGQAAGRIHLHLPTIHSSWLTGEIPPVMLPRWMRERSGSEALVLQAGSAQPDTPNEQPAARPSPVWRELSLLAILDEPELFSGSAVRLTTWSGRIHEGMLKRLSEEKRLVLALPRGADQVELHFHPLDIRLIEERVSNR